LVIVIGPALIVVAETIVACGSVSVVRLSHVRLEEEDWA
jgi:hypothetical protein